MPPLPLPDRRFSGRGRGQVAALLVTDLCVLAACACVSWYLKSLHNANLPVEQYVQILPVFLLAAAVSYGSFGLYPALGFGPADELRRLSHATTLVFLAGVALTFVSKAGTAWSRQVFLVAWMLGLVGIPLARAAVRRLCCRRSWWGIPCVILGAGETGARVAQLLASRPWLGLRPVALLDDDASKHGGALAGCPVEGPVVAGAERLSRAGIRHGILAIPGLPASQQAAMLDALGEHLRHVLITPALPGSPDVIAEPREFANTLVLEVRQNLLRPEIRALKRIIDALGSALGFLLFWWVFAGIALAIRLSSPGPAFYGQRRIGRDGRAFTAWKFRSMVRDADALLNGYLERHPELRAEWERDHKLKDDPRVTWIGSLLRRTSLDELPQLWNVLNGEMSLVGPRPIVADEIPKYGDRFGLYQKVRPGMSGLWQVSGRNDTTYAERVALDCYYTRNWSVWLDLVILARTLRVVLLGKGAY